MKTFYLFNLPLWDFYCSLVLLFFDYFDFEVVEVDLLDEVILFKAGFVNPLEFINEIGRASCKERV